MIRYKVIVDVEADSLEEVKAKAKQIGKLQGVARSCEVGPEYGEQHAKASRGLWSEIFDPPELTACIGGRGDIIFEIHLPSKQHDADTAQSEVTK